MKIIRIFVLLLLAATTGSAMAQSDGELNLTPSKYPNSVLEAFADEADGDVFYTKDSYSKVNTYYTQVYGYPKNEEGINYFKVRLLLDKSASDSSNLVFNVADKAKLVEVLERAKFDNYYVSQALSNLRRAYIDMNTTTALKIDPMTFANDPKVRRAIEKFSYLLKRFYTRTSIPSTSGESQYMGIEQVLYDEFFIKPEDDRAKELKTMQDDYLTLVQQGELSKAQELSTKINEFTTTSSEDPEQAYYNIVDYLMELEKISFNTKIIIYD